MPKFFFEITNGITLKDAQGLWCHDLADARTKAIIIAEKVAAVERNLPGPARHISVRDSTGTQVDAVPVRDGAAPVRNGIVTIKAPGH
jgi:hypothetical protein